MSEHVASCRLGLSWPRALAVAMTGGVAAAKGHPFSTPGYHWNHKLPKVAPVIPGKLIKLGDGADPRVLVDAAGTGQIAYTTTPTDVSGPSVLHDCVLLRGQTGARPTTAWSRPRPGTRSTTSTTTDRRRWRSATSC